MLGYINGDTWVHSSMPARACPLPLAHLLLLSGPAWALLQMRHVGAAIAEMFNTGHVKLLREACRLERLVLASIYLETTSRWGKIHGAAPEGW